MRAAADVRRKAGIEGTRTPGSNAEGLAFWETAEPARPDAGIADRLDFGRCTATARPVRRNGSGRATRADRPADAPRLAGQARAGPGSVSHWSAVRGVRPSRRCAERDSSISLCGSVAAYS